MQQRYSAFLPEEDCWIAYGKKRNNLTELANNNRSNEEVEEILSDIKRQELTRAKARVKPSEEDRKSKREFAKLLQSKKAL